MDGIQFWGLDHFILKTVSSPFEVYVFSIFVTELAITQFAHISDELPFCIFLLFDVFLPYWLYIGIRQHCLLKSFDILKPIVLYQKCLKILRFHCPSNQIHRICGSQLFARSGQGGASDKFSPRHSYNFLQRRSRIGTNGGDRLSKLFMVSRHDWRRLHHRHRLAHSAEKCHGALMLLAFDVCIVSILAKW